MLAVGGEGVVLASAWPGRSRPAPPPDPGRRARSPARPAAAGRSPRRRSAGSAPCRDRSRGSARRPRRRRSRDASTRSPSGVSSWIELDVPARRHSRRSPGCFLSSSPRRRRSGACPLVGGHAPDVAPTYRLRRRTGENKLHVLSLWLQAGRQPVPTGRDEASSEGGVTCPPMSSGCPRPDPSLVLESSFLSCPVRLPGRSQPADFSFTYTPARRPRRPGQRWSTWDDIGILAGPEPWPDWVITESAAIDTELGILKTGKEADVHPAGAGHRRPIGGARRQALPRPSTIGCSTATPATPRAARCATPATAGPTAKGTRWGRHGPGRPVGPGRVRLSRRSVVSRAAGALPGAAGRRRDLDGVHHPGRRHRRPAAGPDPARPGRCWRRTGTSSPRPCG